MPDIRETALPGIGVRHEFACVNGARVGVVSRHSGRKELVLYDRKDPDAVRGTVDLSSEEAAALGELLGGSRIVESLTEAMSHVEGLAIDWVELPPGFTPGRIAERIPRTRTGVTVVAIVRAHEAMPAPGPDAELLPDDTVLIIGTTERVARLADELAHGGP